MIMMQAAFHMLAGHETTARFLQYTFMLLAAHPGALIKLRQEIEDYKKEHKVTSWTKQDIANLPYLNMVLNESLRLYPPVPILARAVVKPLTLHKLPRFKNILSKAEFEEAKQHRDKKEDINLKADSTGLSPDLIILAPFASHLSKKQYKDPEKFIPERFDPKRKDLRPEGQDTIDDCTFYPFGVFDRKCVGSKFAMQEAGLVLINTAPRFDIIIPDGLTHPFPVEYLGTLRPKESVMVRFAPRDQKKAETEMKNTDDVHLETSLASYTH